MISVNFYSIISLNSKNPKIPSANLLYHPSPNQKLSLYSLSNLVHILNLSSNLNLSFLFQLGHGVSPRQRNLPKLYYSIFTFIFLPLLAVIIIFLSLRYRDFNSFISSKTFSISKLEETFTNTLFFDCVPEKNFPALDAN